MRVIAMLLALVYITLGAFVANILPVQTYNWHLDGSKDWLSYMSFSVILIFGLGNLLMACRGKSPDIVIKTLRGVSVIISLFYVFLGSMAVSELVITQFNRPLPDLPFYTIWLATIVLGFYVFVRALRTAPTNPRS